MIMYRKMTMLVTALVLGSSTIIGGLTSASPALARAHRQHHASPAQAYDGKRRRRRLIFPSTRPEARLWVGFVRSIPHPSWPSGQYCAISVFATVFISARFPAARTFVFRRICAPFSYTAAFGIGTPRARKHPCA
jgi:hypothetical protein